MGMQCGGRLARFFPDCGSGLRRNPVGTGRVAWTGRGRLEQPKAEESEDDDEGEDG
jgi:hypothetical protein